MTTTATQAPDGQLGQIVTWRVPSQVSVDQLRAALTAANLEQDLAGDLHPQHVLSRALRDMKAGRVIAKLQRVDDDHVRFQLTRQHIDDAGASYEREALVTLDLRTSYVTADDAAIAEQARALVAEHTAKRLTNDVSRLIQRVYDTHRADLIAIREQGGAYFVPDTHKALVDATRTLLASIGGKLQSFAVRLGCADTAESVAGALADHLSAMVTELRESCAALTTDSRADVINRRTGRIAELRRRLDCYHGLLGAYTGTISAAIADTERDLLARIAQPASGPGLSELDPA
jgi:hypothetical protein